LFGFRASAARKEKPKANTLKCVPLSMNRSFLIIVVPAIAVGIGYMFVLRWLGYQLEPFRFVMAAVIGLAALFFVQRYQRRKAARRSR
jgi:ABC-type spermidine/putrescine transport system permease subunit II